MDEPYCPIIFSTLSISAVVSALNGGYPQTSVLDAQSRCMEQECAWYDAERKTCGVAKIDPRGE